MGGAFNDQRDTRFVVCLTNKLHSARTHTHTKYIYIYIFQWIFLSIYLSIYIYIYIKIYVYVYVHIYINIYIYIYIHNIHKVYSRCDDRHFFIYPNSLVQWSFLSSSAPSPTFPTIFVCHRKTSHQFECGENRCQMYLRGSQKER